MGFKFTLVCDVPASSVEGAYRNLRVGIKGSVRKKCGLRPIEARFPNGAAVDPSVLQDIVERVDKRYSDAEEE